MQLITIGTKNQIVIPKQIRQKIKGLKPGRKVTLYPLDEETVAIKVTRQSWLDSSYGAMKRSWSEQKPLCELEKIRNEWDTETP